MKLVVPKQNSTIRAFSFASALLLLEGCSASVSSSIQSPQRPSIVCGNIISTTFAPSQEPPDRIEYTPSFGSYSFDFHDVVLDNSRYSFAHLNFFYSRPDSSGLIPLSVARPSISSNTFGVSTPIGDLTFSFSVSTSSSSNISGTAARLYIPIPCSGQDTFIYSLDCSNPRHISSSSSDYGLMFDLGGGAIWVGQIGISHEDKTRLEIRSGEVGFETTLRDGDSRLVKIGNDSTFRLTLTASRVNIDVCD